MKRERFERMVDELLDELPDEFASAIENVDFVVEDGPDAEAKKELGIGGRTMLMGYYQGVPLPHRSPSWYSGALPDRIVLFRESIEAAARTPAGVREVLRRTLYHEIAHYFGISDKRLRELGVY